MSNENVLRFRKVMPEKTPCFLHAGKGYKKGCKDCFEANQPNRDDDHWHDTWERDNFGDRD